LSEVVLTKEGSLLVLYLCLCMIFSQLKSIIKVFTAIYT